MSLPATVVEAEALQFARTWIAECLESDSPALNMVDADRQAPGRAMLRAHMKDMAGSHPFLAADIVYFARHGFDDADRALKELIAERVERNEPLGAVLGAYAIELVHPRRPRQGRRKETHFYQDLQIYILVEQLVEKFGLKPTRNVLSRRRPSACTVVARACNEANIGRRFDANGRAVEAIFWRFVPIDAGRPVAAGTRFADGLPADYQGLLD